jgi:prostaglandin reductase 1
MVKAKVFIYASQFQGEPKSTDIELIEEDLPAVKDGEFLAKALFMSVDPYMRPYMARFPLKSVMIGSQIAE